MTFFKICLFLVLQLSLFACGKYGRLYKSVEKKNVEKQQNYQPNGQAELNDFNL